MPASRRRPSPASGVYERGVSSISTRSILSPGSRSLCGSRSRIELTTSIPSTTSRSEEHTSELQSRQYLVCRLLLEKKKNTTLLSSHPPPFCPPTLAATQ